MKAITVKALRDYLNALDSRMDDYAVVVSDEFCTESSVVGFYENHDSLEFNLDIMGRMEA